MHLLPESSPMEYNPQENNQNNNDRSRVNGGYQSDFHPINSDENNYQNNNYPQSGHIGVTASNVNGYSQLYQNPQQNPSQGFQQNPQQNLQQNFESQQQYQNFAYRSMGNRHIGNQNMENRPVYQTELRPEDRNSYVDQSQTSRRSLFSDDHLPLEELVVKVEGVKFKRGFKELYQGLNAEFQPGTVTGIIGRNGVGKSTLISLISGEFKPHSGIITINGVPVNEIPSRARVFGVVSESYGLPSGMKTKNALKYWCHIIDAPLSRIDKLVKDLEMESFLNTRVRRLSTGQRKKVELAFALLGDQNILLLDEPFNGLDVETSGLIRSVISELQNQGKTILLITHVLVDIDRLASSSYVLTDGLFYKLDYPAGIPGAVEDAYNKLMRRGKYAR